MPSTASETGIPWICTTNIGVYAWLTSKCMYDIHISSTILIWQYYHKKIPTYTTWLPSSKPHSAIDPWWEWSKGSDNSRLSQNCSKCLHSLLLTDSINLNLTVSHILVTTWQKLCTVHQKPACIMMPYIKWLLYNLYKTIVIEI